MKSKQNICLNLKDLNYRLQSRNQHQFHTVALQIIIIENLHKQLEPNFHITTTKKTLKYIRYTKIQTYIHK